MADLWGAFKGRVEPSHPCAFGDIDQLTMFADYRVPQILRDIGILRYSESLARTIDERRELPAGCEEEAEIRACTIVAVERLHAELMKRKVPSSEEAATARKGWTGTYVLEVDWFLWQWGEARCAAGELAPNHRTLTIYY